MEILGNQIDEAILKQDPEKAAELAQKLTELEKNLGPEYRAQVECWVKFCRCKRRVTKIILFSTTTFA